MRDYIDDKFWKMFFGFISIVALSILFILVAKTADLKISSSKTANVINYNR
jgi:hypothetical protein